MAKQSDDRITWPMVFDVWSAETRSLGLPDHDERLFATATTKAIVSVEFVWMPDWRMGGEHIDFWEGDSRKGLALTAEFLFTARKLPELVALFWMKACMRHRSSCRAYGSDRMAMFARRVVEQFCELEALIEGCKPRIDWHHMSLDVLPTQGPLDELYEATNCGALPLVVSWQSYIGLCARCRAVAHAGQTCVVVVGEGQTVRSLEFAPHVEPSRHWPTRDDINADRRWKSHREQALRLAEVFRRERSAAR